MILLIDNYDSFTYNLVQVMASQGASLYVFRNDEITVDQALARGPSGIVLSPGPCTPNEAGICVALIRRVSGRLPILGVCLGHQCIGAAFGGVVSNAGRIMHGKTSMIYHRSQGVFTDLPQPFEATRYHSLVVEPGSLPDSLAVMAWTEYQGGHEIMGLKHHTYPIEGVQFHPESILTRCGHDLLRNFLKSIH